MTETNSARSGRKEVHHSIRAIFYGLLLFALTGCGGGAGAGGIVASGVNKTPLVATMSAATMATDAAVSIGFSADVDPATVNPSSIRVTGPEGAVTGSVGYDSATKTATFTPAAPLMPLTSYTVSLTAGIKDAAGSTVGEKTWRVATGTDLLARDAGDVVPATLFGNHMHRALTGTAWPTVKFGTWRLWDAFVTWPDLEPVKGAWNFTRLDAYVDMAEQRGVELLLPLSQSPRWASARPDEPSAYGPGKAAEPANLDDWKNYVSAVATRYKGRIHYYELWNEINAKNFYTGTTDQMILLAKSAYETIKAIDPSATVISPSFCPPENHTEMFDDYLAKGGANYADAFTYHFYVKPGTPEQMISFVNAVKAVMARHGVTKPLWNTESGWYIESSAKPAGAAGADRYLTYHEAAAYIARSYVLQWAMGVDRFYLYAWDNYNSGLVQNDGTTLKPSASAYNQIATWLEGASVKSCGKNSAGTWVAAIARANGSKGWIVWTTEGEKSFNVPAEWGVDKVSDLYGNTSSLNGNNAAIGIAPVLFSKNQGMP